MLPYGKNQRTEGNWGWNYGEVNFDVGRHDCGYSGCEVDDEKGCEKKNVLFLAIESLQEAIHILFFQ